MRAASILLRPSVLTSVLAHAGLVAVAFSAGTSPAAFGPPARIVAALWDAETEGESETQLPEVEVTAPRRLDSEFVGAPLVLADENLPPEESTLEDPSAPPAASADPAPLWAPTLPLHRIRRPPLGAEPARPAVPGQTVQPALAKPGRVLVSPRPLASNLTPVYPHEARLQGWQGVTVLLVTIGLDGRVASVSVERSSGYPILDGTAEATARSWSYTPPVVQGVVTEVTVRVRVPFRLT